MQTKEQIELKIKGIKLEIDEMHEQRKELFSKYGGIMSEQNADMLQDITTLSNQIKILDWVLS